MPPSGFEQFEKRRSSSLDLSSQIVESLALTNCESEVRFHLRAAEQVIRKLVRCRTDPLDLRPLDAVSSASRTATRSASTAEARTIAPTDPARPATVWQTSAPTNNRESGSSGRTDRPAAPRRRSIVAIPVKQKKAQQKALLVLPTPVEPYRDAPAIGAIDLLNVRCTVEKIGERTMVLHLVLPTVNVETHVAAVLNKDREPSCPENNALMPRLRPPLSQDTLKILDQVLTASSFSV